MFDALIQALEYIFELHLQCGTAAQTDFVLLHVTRQGKKKKTKFFKEEKVLKSGCNNNNVSFCLPAEFGLLFPLCISLTHSGHCAVDTVQ